MDCIALSDFENFTPAELSELYEKDPALFNELAAAALDRACIGNTFEQTIRLQQTQWLIDGQLRKAKTPLQRMHIMENIFYSRLFGDDGELVHLSNRWNELFPVLPFFIFDLMQSLSRSTKGPSPESLGTKTRKSNQCCNCLSFVG